MTVLPIVTDLAALRVKSQPVTVFDDDLRALAADMVDTMRANNGVGLAAVQVGRPIRLIVFVLRNGETEPRPVVMANPAVVWRSGYTVLSQEGCLSLPGQTAVVPRDKAIRLVGKDVYGFRISRLVRFESAIPAQHEIDHLNGVLITDYAQEAAR